MIRNICIENQRSFDMEREAQRTLEQQLHTHFHRGTPGGTGTCGEWVPPCASASPGHLLEKRV